MSHPDIERQIAELHKIGRSADRVDRERAEQFQSLIKHPGWASFVGLLDAKIQGFSDLLLRPAGSVDGCVALEYVKGTMSGLLLARDLPSATIQGAEQISTTDDAEGDDE